MTTTVVMRIEMSRYSTPAAYWADCKIRDLLDEKHKILKAFNYSAEELKVKADLGELASWEWSVVDQIAEIDGKLLDLDPRRLVEGAVDAGC